MTQKSLLFNFVEPSKKICWDYDLRRCTIDEVRDLCSIYHPYKSAGGTGTYCFGVYENNQIVAAYAWQPPPPGSAKSVCPEAPQGVLSLSRMVAVPRELRQLNHVSRPLRRQMKHEIDRGRWPVLVTYSDEGAGHTGHVYKCSGWEKVRRTKATTYTNLNGDRVSRYANGKRANIDGLLKGVTHINRWEQWICPRGLAADHMLSDGWTREPIIGKTWASGKQAYRYINRGTP